MTIEKQALYLILMCATYCKAEELPERIKHIAGPALFPVDQNAKTLAEAATGDTLGRRQELWRVPDAPNPDKYNY